MKNEKQASLTRYFLTKNLKRINESVYNLTIKITISILKPLIIKRRIALITS